MAAPRKYPLPPTQLRVILVELRREGLEFDDAWPSALRQVKWPYDTQHRREWKAVLEEYRETWRDSYEFREAETEQKFLSELMQEL